MRIVPLIDHEIWCLSKWNSQCQPFFHITLISNLNIWISSIYFCSLASYNICLLKTVLTKCSFRNFNAELIWFFMKFAKNKIKLINIAFNKYILLPETNILFYQVYARWMSLCTMTSLKLIKIFSVTLLGKCAFVKINL